MRKRVTSKNILCDALIEMMEEKSVFDIKVTELVDYAKVSRSSFYMYFDSVFDVLDLVEDQFLAEFPTEEKIRPSTDQEKVLVDLEQMLTYIRDHMGIFRVLSGPHGSYSFQAKMNRRGHDFFHNLSIVEKTQLTEAEVDLLCENILGGRWSMFRWWATHENEITIDMMAVTVKQVMNQALQLFNS